MTREQLEMLLLDRSLGGCSPEVSALLDAYLEKDEAARSEAERWRGLVGRARAAMKAERAVLPPFPRERWLRRERLVRAWRIGAAVSGIAACIVAGVLVGPFWSQSGKGPTPMVKAPVEPAKTVATEPAGGVEDFWSVARIERTARQNGGGGALGSTPRPAGWERFNSGNPFGGVR